MKDAPENQTLYSGLVNGQTVCAGYARTFQYLMNRLDIPVIYVTGTTDTGEAHGWNIVKCGDNYYNVDVTLGRSGIRRGRERRVQSAGRPDLLRFSLRFRCGIFGHASGGCESAAPGVQCR